MAYTDSFPAGYYEARNRLSPQFVRVFDKLIDESTPGFFTNLMYFTIVLIPWAFLVTWGYSRQRDTLYKDLVTISDCPERRRLVITQPCIMALEDHTINLKDLADCPLNSLELILRPDILRIIRQNKVSIDHQKYKALSQLSTLRDQASALKEHGQINSGLQNRIAAKEDEIERMKTSMERLREDNYSVETIELLFYGQTHAPVRSLTVFTPAPTDFTAQAAYPLVSAERIEEEEQQTQNSSFLMALIAHPATPILSAVTCVASLLFLGLITVGIVPLSISSMVVSSLTLATSIGLFAGSYVSSSEHEQMIRINSGQQPTSRGLSAGSRDLA